jgi:hypothetical protein
MDVELQSEYFSPFSFELYHGLEGATKTKWISFDSSNSHFVIFWIGRYNTV